VDAGYNFHFPAEIDRLTGVSHRPVRGRGGERPRRAQGQEQANERDIGEDSPVPLLQKVSSLPTG
jgi:hypothetical protein